jgi:hypothetical protein
MRLKKMAPLAPDRKGIIPSGVKRTHFERILHFNFTCE